MWAAIIAAGVGCYLLKLAGLSVPARVLERPVVRRVADLIPVALLSALVAVQVFSSGHRLVLDERAAGLAAAVVLLLLRAPFLIPVALLSALVAVQVFSSGHRLVLDERAAGLAAAVVLLLLRAPFLVVVFGAALTAALLRLAG